MSINNRPSYVRLRDAITQFVGSHPHPDVALFKDSMANWGRDWFDADPCDLPATGFLEMAIGLNDPATHPMVAMFAAEKANLKWEQSYTKADGLVGDDMLSGYGFAEVIGKRGPFISEKIRSGIGVWGPHIDYPLHRHAAEEIYIVLAGSARFQLGEDNNRESSTHHAGYVVYVPSMLTHGFSTAEQPLVVLYVWQAGDLREKSSFS